ncbi:MAG: GNAT family N-acetyltransferase [Ruminococcaceae bacterium]|nr:GNAT family N-acetyltransferase [Oscillospiraceae bacterium]
MVEVIRSLPELPFGELMSVYEEGNRDNGAERYPDLSANLQLLEAEQDFYAYLKCFFLQEDSFYVLWRQDGELVSALRIEPYQDGWLLAALETKPGYRNRGYAKRLVRELLTYMEETKRLPVYSHISKRNISSQKVHLSCGFRAILPYAVYADGTTNDLCNTYIYDKKTL